MTASHRPPLAAVLGWPVGHSKSPRLHGYWLQRHGINGGYIAMGIEPKDFQDAFKMLPRLGFRGVNVTIPFKETVLRLADQVSDRAALIGAANTITFGSDGRSFADNTDGYGFLENIRAQHPEWRGADGPAVVLGAGGAARAIISALLGDGAPRVILTNRTKARAELLAESFGAKVQVVDWLHSENAMADAATIVNATSLGMVGQAPFQVSLAAAPRTALVNDLVYTPLRTTLLEDARARGLRNVDGLGMLLHQGRPGFEAWFGVTPEVDDDLRTHMLDALC